MGGAGMPMLWRRGSAALAVAMLLAVVSGCGYRRPPLVKAEARVTLDGEPVAGATVMLVPAGGGRPVSGVTDEGGRLTFSTYGSRDGVPTGRYTAVVSKLVLTKKAARRMEASRSATASGDDVAEPMIETRDEDYENLLPGRYAGIDTSDLTVTVDRGTRAIELPLVSEKPVK